MSRLTTPELPTGEKSSTYLFDIDWERLIIWGHGSSCRAGKVMFTLTDEIKTRHQELPHKQTEDV